MKIYRKTSNIKKKNSSIVSIGNFDGLHLGHQEILKTVKKEALKQELESTVISFYPSPASFLYPKNFKGHINTDLEKIEKMNSYKIDNFLMLQFDNKIRNMKAEYFLSDIIIKYFNPKTIIIGYDHRFGYNREGDYDFLNANKSKYGYNLIKVKEKFFCENKLSSSNIRRLLSDRDVKTAAGMLGSLFEIRGEVVKGEGVGRTIGFPTANIEIDNLKLLPGNGVYFVSVSIDNGKPLFGMCNIGVRPTVKSNKAVSCEIHIFNFNQIIYGKALNISFIEFIRLERKFDSLSCLKKQLIEDENKCLEYSYNNV